MIKQRMAATLTLLLSSLSLAQNYDTNLSTRLNIGDYGFESYAPKSPDIFDTQKVIDADLDVSVRSDCGRINFNSTLRSSLKNILDSQYFADMGKDILASSPLLVTCYMSPTWCAILKHSQLSAHMMSQARLKQCSLIDKYTDSRVQDFEQERQTCIKQYIHQYGGDLEQALDHCQSPLKLTSWSGKGKAEGNKLLESSATWAGMTTPQSQQALSMIRSVVGDTFLSNGVMKVQFGPKSEAPQTPYALFTNLKSQTETLLCENLMPTWIQNPKQFYQLEQQPTFQKLSTLLQEKWMTRQTVESLASLPAHQRQIACRSLAQAMAKKVFERNVQTAESMLGTMEQNPYLPPHRKLELRDKAQTFSELSRMAMDQSDAKPIEDVLKNIEQSAQESKTQKLTNQMGYESATHRQRTQEKILWDCADGVMCRK